MNEKSQKACKTRQKNKLKRNKKTEKKQRKIKMNKKKEESGRQRWDFWVGWMKVSDVK